VSNQKPLVGVPAVAVSRQKKTSAEAEVEMKPDGGGQVSNEDRTLQDD